MFSPCTALYARRPMPCLLPQGASSSGQAGALERGAVQQPAAPRLERGPTPRDAPGAQPDTNKAQAPSIVAAAPEAVPLSSAATKKAAIAQNGYLTFSSPQKVRRACSSFARGRRPSRARLAGGFSMPTHRMPTR